MTTLNNNVKEVKNVSNDAKNVSNKTKKVLNLNDAKNKDIVLKAKKEAIKEGTKFNFKDLDFVNLRKETEKIKVTKSSKSLTKNFLYKFERLELDEKKQKSLRVKIRKNLSNKIDNIIYYFNEQNENDLILSIKDFKVFYLDTYVLNDYSINSICANNTDVDKIKKIEIALKIVSKF